MRILLSGYVLGEGRMSMVRFGRTLREYLVRTIDSGDRVALDEPSNELPGVPMLRHGITVKLEKRIGVPLRLRLTPYDLLHIVDSDYAAAIPNSRLARTVVTCHDTMPFLQREHGLPDTFGRFGRRFFEQSLRKMSACARIAADSNFTRECILKFTACSPERIEVVPLAIDHDAFKPIPKDATSVAAFRQRHNIEGKDIILHVGTGAWYKNVETVLQVVHELVRRGRSNLVLLKVGRLSHSQIDLADQLGLRNRIIQFERVADEEVPLLYSASDILLWPSLCEGFGLPILEAMACGTPVVCSNGGSLAEIAGTAAAVHDPHDVNGLAESCLRLLESPSAFETAQAKGIAHAAGYRWDRTAATYYRIYKEVLQ